MKGFSIALAAIMLTLVAAARAEQRIDLVVASTGFQVLAPLAAKEAGFFGKQNLNVEVTLVGGGSKALAAVLGGDAQIYAGVPSTAFAARARGGDAMVFGNGFAQIGSNFVMAADWASAHHVTEATPYRDKLAALKGITVGVQTPGDGTDQVVHFLAKDAGLNPERDMTIVSLGTGEAMTAAFAAARIQGFLQSAPVGENAIHNDGAVMFLNTTHGEIPALNGFFYIGQIAEESWLQKNPDVAVRYLRAVQMALDAMHDPKAGPAVRDAVYARYYAKTDRTLYDATWASTLPAFPDSVVIPEKSIAMVIDFMNGFKAGSIDPAVAAKAWTNAYAEKAVQGLKPQ